jgi:hypothetical protein
VRRRLSRKLCLRHHESVVVLWLGRWLRLLHIRWGRRTRRQQRSRGPRWPRSGWRQRPGRNGRARNGTASGCL